MKMVYPKKMVLDKLLNTKDPICLFNKDLNSMCGLCLVRSTCMRLRSRGRTGPKKLKPYEAAFILGRLQSEWRGVNVNFARFIEETLIIMGSKPKPLHLKCKVCEESDGYFKKEVIQMPTEKISNIGPLSIGDIISTYLNKEETLKCNHGINNLVNCTRKKMIIIQFSNPLSINLREVSVMFKSKLSLLRFYS